MNVLDILVNYLKENGYDGLYYDDECGCELDDICPCGELSLNCEPGYKIPAPEGHEAVKARFYDWYICKSKDAEPWNE